MSRPSNEQIAHDMAMAFIQADLSSMSGNERLEEIEAIKDDADPTKPNTSTIIDNFNHYYQIILKDLR
ncbi:hypothetical protein MM193_00275 [Limosilactobacillus reuteri]|uniref:hypothetical protein n=1 Tax=Limosilactobacillus reuteri TaxID=1598 RepID=UPI001F4D777A|nr:hypothetical protein [Limosilactobacillus reuteri]MCH9393134.1 hypothetical protein [Limosilactobacillus reuteri]